MDNTHAISGMNPGHALREKYRHRARVTLRAVPLLLLLAMALALRPPVSAALPACQAPQATPPVAHHTRGAALVYLLHCPLVGKRVCVCPPLYSPPAVRGVPLGCDPNQSAWTTASPAVLSRKANSNSPAFVSNKKVAVLK